MDLVVVWWSIAVAWEEVVWGHLVDLGSTFRQHLKMIQSTILAQSYQHELSGHSLRPPERHESHYSQNCKSPATSLHQKNRVARRWPARKNTHGWCRGCQTVKKRMWLAFGALFHSENDFQVVGSPRRSFVLLFLSLLRPHSWCWRRLEL